jgi:DMSO/TMAO reductase YedYZ molybdopterin-dependent catalytic subunit
MLQDHFPAKPLPWRLITPIALVCGFLAACGGGDADATTPPADPQVAVGGSVDHPTNYTVAQLKTQTPITQTVTFASGTTPQTHTYTGASLWMLLDTAAVKVSTAKNDILNKIVVATGADGYRAIFSLGELKPDFGNRGNLVAYEESVGGVATPLTNEGSIRVTAPSDVKGGRYVSALVRLEVQPSASTQAGTGGGVSTQFSVSGAVAHPGTFNLAALQALPAIDKTIGTNTYRGVSLWSFLNTTVGITTNAARSRTTS